MRWVIAADQEYQQGPATSRDTTDTVPMQQEERKEDCQDHADHASDAEGAAGSSSSLLASELGLIEALSSLDLDLHRHQRAKATRTAQRSNNNYHRSMASSSSGPRGNDSAVEGSDMMHSMTSCDYPPVLEPILGIPKPGTGRGVLGPTAAVAGGGARGGREGQRQDEEEVLQLWETLFTVTHHTTSFAAALVPRHETSRRNLVALQRLFITMDRRRERTCQAHIDHLSYKHLSTVPSTGAGAAGATASPLKQLVSRSLTTLLSHFDLTDLTHSP